MRKHQKLMLEKQSSLPLEIQSAVEHWKSSSEYLEKRITAISGEVAELEIIIQSFGIDPSLVLQSGAGLIADGDCKLEASGSARLQRGHFFRLKYPFNFRSLLSIAKFGYLSKKRRIDIVTEYLVLRKHKTIFVRQSRSLLETISSTSILRAAFKSADKNTQQSKIYSLETIAERELITFKAHSSDGDRPMKLIDKLKITRHALFQKYMEQACLSSNEKISPDFKAFNYETCDFRLGNDKAYPLPETIVDWDDIVPLFELGTTFCHRVHIPKRWISRVYSKNIAIVDGNLILDSQPVQVDKTGSTVTVAHATWLTIEKQREEPYVRFNQKTGFIAYTAEPPGTQKVFAALGANADIALTRLHCSINNAHCYLETSHDRDIKRAATSAR